MADLPITRDRTLAVVAQGIETIREFQRGTQSTMQLNAAIIDAAKLVRRARAMCARLEGDDRAAVERKLLVFRQVYEGLMDQAQARLNLPPV